MLLVVLYHAGLSFPGGFVGVDSFFVISGFVICTVLVAELEVTGRIRFGDFYARRVRRLFPALAIVSLAGLAAAVLVASPAGPQQTALRTVRSAALFVSNLFLFRNGGGYFDAADETNPFLHMWSLSVEEQFYLVLPALIAGLWALGLRVEWGPRRVVFAGVGLAAAASLALSVVLTRPTPAYGFRDPERLAFYSMPTRLWEFAAGVLLALAGHRIATSASTRTWLGASGMLLLLGAALGFGDRTLFPGVAAAAPVVGTGLLIVAGADDGVVRAQLSRPGLTWLGDRSYGWYLWHWPFIVFAGVLWPTTWAVRPIAAVVSLVVAATVYRVVEDPIRRDRRIVGPVAAGVAVACIGVPAAAASMSLVGSEGGWGLDLPQNDEAMARKHGCHTDTGSLDWDASACTIPVDDPAGTILLLGDSHAASLSDVGARVANSLGYDFAMWTRSGCPFHARPAEGIGQCAQWQRRALDLVAELRPAVVLVVNRSPVYIRPTIGEEEDPILDAAGQPIRDHDRALAEWGDGLQETLEGVESLGAVPVVVGTVPEFPENPVAAASIVRPTGITTPLSLEDLAARRGEVLAVEREVVAGGDRSVLVDPAPVLCDVDCQPRVDGQWLYYDADHLTPSGSLRIAPVLRSTVLEAIGR